MQQADIEGTAIMSFENIERIAVREVSIRRRNRITLAGLCLAVGVVMASLVTAI